MGIRDRGNIKWTAMMLPEHVKLLRDWKEEDRIQKRPELDEQKLEEMNEIIHEAMAFNQTLSFVYFERERYRILVGDIHYADPVRKELRIVDEFGDRHDLKLKDILDIRYL
ncbi:YolD-like family protein [Pseudalkalibacillus salsuginis]|uniref:YolD-like family protein n=1 Tax=Pseudalkalibacillus salsuginis TaxID=2910972 RepID=UPI001F1B5C63|nr:YolD-like family protein [Pseudalkalibacillus salsuginis]MCF6408333.1 YolD-like family protein [Pseudalkalibacillus salsuginis]